MTDSPTVPCRVQLSRKKGWRMPEGAKKVDRSSPMFGNPFVLGEPVPAPMPTDSPPVPQPCPECGGEDMELALDRYAAASGFKASAPYYPVEADEAGDASLYCLSCVAAKGRYARAETIGHDTCLHCATCGVVLDYTLSKYGIARELTHYRDYPPKATPEEAHHVARLLESAPDNPEVIEIARGLLSACAGTGSIDCKEEEDGDV